MDELEDERIVVGGVPFIAEESFIDQFGPSFELVMEEGRLAVRAVRAPLEAACGLPR